ncbi:molybdenum cofactor guanylyltransferase MobA [Paracoccus liaowanqingii]|uniref:Molybdenum cofactor guanylyltransferase n=1 Tax=Paracoccus liaowanqingii TaxID=2560053 RepID=A0A4P7HQZ3_9RHOB|nr:molybdenum cofactor guanylyltransferase MobA [Paracoccus liaowanqingii]QBX35741.1 molybdenum cofactor guanylyltransferase MobA [Paracoccus liaowanqingii]
MTSPQPPTTTLPAMILAGGRATRMGGGDKPLLPLGGRSMLAHVLDRLRPQAGPVALNANGDPARFAAFGLPVRADSLPDHPGPLAGVLAALDWAAGIGADHVLTVAGDTPFLPPDLTLRLQAARGPRGLALAASRTPGGETREHPTVGLWPVALRDDLAATLAAGQRRMRVFTARHQPGLALWPGDPDPFANINTPDDLARAEARLAAL